MVSFTKSLALLVCCANASATSNTQITQFLSSELAGNSQLKSDHVRLFRQLQGENEDSCAVCSQNVDDLMKNFPAMDEAAKCNTKAVMPFYCDTFCTQTCKTFLAETQSGSGGEESSEGDSGSGSNDDNNPSSPQRVLVESDDGPPWFLQSGNIEKTCDKDSCIQKYISAITTYSKAIAKCPKQSLETSNVPSETSIDEMLKPMNTMCQKNKAGNFCMATMADIQEIVENEEEPRGEVTCELPIVKSLVDIGCCYGTMLSIVEEDETSNDETSNDETASSYKMEDASYWVSKCGGNVMPCNSGAMFSTSVIKSSLKLNAEGLTLEMLEKPESTNALSASVAKAINAKANSKLIKKTNIIITSVKVASHTTRRSLAHSSFDIDYSIIQQGGDISKLETAMKGGVPSSAVTDELKSDSAFSSLSSTLEAVASTADPVVEVTGKPNSAAALKQPLASVLLAMGFVAIFSSL